MGEAKRVVLWWLYSSGSVKRETSSSILNFKLDIAIARGDYIFHNIWCLTMYLLWALIFKIVEVTLEIQ